MHTALFVAASVRHAAFARQTGASDKLLQGDYAPRQADRHQRSCPLPPPAVRKRRAKTVVGKQEPWEFLVGEAERESITGINGPGLRESSQNVRAAGGCAYVTQGVVVNAHMLLLP